MSQYDGHAAKRQRTDDGGRGSSSTSFLSKKSDSENVKLSENDVAVILTSFKALPVVSHNLSSPHKDVNADIGTINMGINKNKISHVSSDSISFKNQQLIEDANICDEVIEIEDENCQVSHNLSSSHKDANVDTENINLGINETKISHMSSSSIPLKNQQFKEDANKYEVIEIEDENCQSKQLPPLMIYLSIYPKNLECLAQGQGLNGLVIDFYLSYIYNEKLTQDLQKRTYICDTFFYKRLSEDRNIINRKNIIVETSKRTSKHVENCLRGVDIFSKDFILIPVWKRVQTDSEKPKGHWYLVIICNLSKLPKTLIYDDESEIRVIDTETVQKSKHSQLTDKRPCIIFFDSLDNSTVLNKEKDDVAKNLKTFLRDVLFNEVKGYNQDKRTYVWSQLKPLKAICPQQTNAHDSGVFLLQFAESFFEKPISNFQDHLNIKHWFNQEIISGKRKIIKEIIQEKMRKR